MNAVSLFANIGVAEALLSEVGIEVVVANEIEKRRADLYSKIYPKSQMICGDINDENIFKQIRNVCIEKKVQVLIATPPCQGMSPAGRQNEYDERNSLIMPVIKMIGEIKPNYVFIENVPMFFNTAIVVDDKKILIPNLLNQELEEDYIINFYVIDTKDYSVPQTRERAIVLMTKKTQQKEWTMPPKDEKIITMREAIGDLPSIDPFIKDISEQQLLEVFPQFYEKKNIALGISRWNIPPHHVMRQVKAMMHTPSGKTAFDNKVYFPTKKNGEPVKGYKNTYKRQNWDTPAYTVTMDNRKISSQNNVHPGRYLGQNSNGEDIYSDARTLTLYEIMIIMSLPKNWPVPNTTSEAFLRRIIGEGIPPLFVKKVFEYLLR